MRISQLLLRKKNFFRGPQSSTTKTKEKKEGFGEGRPCFEGEEENSPSRKQPPKTMSRIRARKAKLTFVKKQYHHEQMDSLLDRFNLPRTRDRDECNLKNPHRHRHRQHFSARKRDKISNQGNTHRADIVPIFNGNNCHWDAQPIVRENLRHPCFVSKDSNTSIDSRKSLQASTSRRRGGRRGRCHQRRARVERGRFARG